MTWLIEYLLKHIHIYSGLNAGIAFDTWGIEFIGDPGVFFCSDQC